MNNYSSSDKQGVLGATLMGNIGVEPLQQNALIIFLLARKLDLNLRCHLCLLLSTLPVEAAQKLPMWNHNN